MPVYTSIEDVEEATQEDNYMQKLKSYIIQGWPHKKDDLEHSMGHYQPIKKWIGNYWWHPNERQENSNSFSIVETNTTAVAQQLHR